MWYAKNYYGYSDGSNEAKAHALNIARTLYAHSWDKKAVCAAIGNASAGESNLNPWRWESEYIPTFNEFSTWSDAEARSHGYGLFQFTPANKYINQTNANTYANYFSPNFSDIQGHADDGEAQVMYFSDSGIYTDWAYATSLYQSYYQAFLNVGVDISGVWGTTLDNFIQGTDNNGNALSVAQLTIVFELGYERPDVANAANSYNARKTSAEYYYGIIPNPPQPHIWGKMNWIYYLKRRRY